MDLSRSPNALAIVGMECRLPGADGLDEYWQMIRSAGSALGPLPGDRFDRDLYFDPKRGTIGKSYTDLGGIVSPRPVDFTELPLPDDLIRGQDPAHLILCEVAARAMRDAGYDPFALPNRNVGVYIGHTGGSEWISDLLYSTIVPEGAQYLRETALFQAMGEEGSRIIDDVVARTRRDHGGRLPNENFDLSGLAAASLISRAFGLSGPYMVADAACASSLQAMAVGIRSLLHGRIDMAIVGGASYCKSDSLVLFSAAQSVSSTGSCPFGASADGLVTAEGYVVLAVKTLERALEDGDRIRAVIRGLGVSSDGKGKSLWAPREEGQKLAVMRAYGEQLDPSRLQYIEAHATSTRLGDATEIRALGSAIRELLPNGTRKLPIGSAKGNVGHTLETAGMAGMIRAILAMEHEVIPPAVGDGHVNEEIPWDETPFYVSFEEEPWPAFEDGHPRRAAVNAFGIGGLNVHVVLDQFVADAPARRPAATAASPLQAGQSSTSAPAPTDPDKLDKAVAVIGYGCILPGAQSVAAMWDLLMSGRDPKSPLPKGRWNEDLFLQSGGPETWKTYSTIGGYIEDFAYDWKRHKVPPLQVSRADPLQFMLLEAADQAFLDAGYGDKPFDRQRVGAVVGTVFGGEFGNQLAMGLRLPEFEKTLTQVLIEKGVPEDRIRETGEQFKKVLLQHMPALLDETGSFTSSTLASRITKTFNLMGGAFAMDAGDCSGHFALQASVDLLLDGTNDMVVCAAGQRGMDVFAYEWMALAGILSPGTPRPPFDERADGIVPGEGCGVVLLKRLADARRDGDSVRAVIRGFGACRSANTATAVETSIRSALSDADLGAGTISAVETAGTGLPENDQLILTATDRVLGSSPRPTPLAVGSIQAQFGDTAGAAGVVSLLKVAQSLREGVLPGTLGFTRPQPALARMTDRIRVSAEPQKISPVSNSNYRAAGITGCSEDLAVHLIVDNGEVVPAEARSAKSVPEASFLARTTAVENPWCLIRFSATDFASMRYKLTKAVNDVEETFRRGGPDVFLPSDVMRLAVVADSVETASKRLRLAIEATLSQSPVQKWQDQGIVLVDRVFPKRRAAALFPGQGSQYAGMLQELAEVSAGARSVLAEAQEIMVGEGWPSFEEIAWEQPDALGHDVWTTQVSLLVADVMAWEAAKAMGLRPDMVGGHSYGEFPALVAAGAWDLKEAMLATRVRCEAIAASKSAPSSMLSVLTSADRVQNLLDQQGGRLWVSAVNGPEQVVLGGEVDAVRQFEASCRQHKITTRLLDVPRAFHTPLMSDTCDPLERGLAVRDLRPVTTPLVSSISAAFVADPNEIRKGLVRQMTVPVLYQQLVQRLYDVGVRVFLELGPSSVLTKMTERILAGSEDVFLESIDHRKRSDWEQMARCQAVLEVHDLARRSPEIRLATRTTPESEQIRNVAPAELPVTTSNTSDTMPPTGPEPSIKFLDATERRRARHRERASTQKGAPAAPTVPLQPDAEPTAPTDSPAPVPQPAVAATATSPPAPAQSPEQAASVPVTKPSAPASEAVPAGDSLDLEQFLVSFVVEQTGYPPEIVELDADLEADLGIDSIKKAQLFGELGEHFAIEPDENLTLDDFPTLAHVRDYLLTQPGVAATPTATGGNGQFAPQEIPPAPVPEPTAPAVTSEPSAQAVAEMPADASPDLEQFLVNFVVEQTGYPEEIVELDADLEADLGIDSIKKAQLFGELGEHFAIEPDENLTLDDFPTLAHVRDYLLTQPGVTAAATTAGGNGEIAAQEIARAETPEQAAPAVAEEPPTQALADEPAGASLDLEQFLVNFVVEQTGYPEEIVEMDADLEADLGIDSIKKAQLFGELGEHFAIEPDENLTLDDFPTLALVRDYLLAQPGVTAAATATGGIGQPTAGEEAPIPAAGQSTTPAAMDSVDRSPVPELPQGIAVLDMSKDAFEVGFRRGRTYRSAIQNLLRRHTDRVSVDLVSAIAGCVNAEACTPMEREELRGMAQGANVLEDGLLAANLGVARTGVLPVGCHWGCRKPDEQESNAGGLAMYLPESPLVAVEVRRFPEGNDYVAAVLPGLLGTLGGVNEAGLGAAVWRADTSAEANAVPRAVCLDVERLLIACSDLDEALEFCGKWNWPNNVWLTLSRADDTCVTAVSWDADGSVHIDKRQWEIALAGAPAIPVTLSRDELLDAAQGYLRRSASATGYALSGLGGGHWLVLTGGTAGLVASSGDDVQLADADSPSSLPVELDIEVPTTSRPSDSGQPGAAASASSGEGVTRRYALRLVETSQGVLTQRCEIRGPVLLLGTNARAAELEEELLRRSVPVTTVPSNQDPTSVRAELESLSRDDLPRTLIVATALDEACATVSDLDLWKRRRQPGLMLPYLVSQSWIQRIVNEELVDDAALVGIVDLGGDLGLSGEMGSPEGGAITGLLKAIDNEFQDLFVRIVDIGAGDADVDAAAAILEECSIRDGEAETALRTLQRMVLRPADQSQNELPRASLPQRGGAWVVTGGARGVTAVVAHELGKRFGLRLHLVGASAVENFDTAWLDRNKADLKAAKAEFMVAARKRGVNPMAEWARLEKSMEIERNLRRMRDDGVEATYHACDVSSPDALRSLLEKIRRTSGPIQGVVHGAGFEAACRFDQKQLENVNRTLASKNDGAACLFALLADDPLEYFIGFGSTSGRLGGIGQTDYAMANDLLAKQVDRFRRERPSVRATVLHWYAWDEVGMAARPESRFALEAFGMTLMPLQEGVDHFIGEIETGLPEPEVLISEPMLCPVTVEATVGEALPEPVAEKPAAAESPPEPAAATGPSGEHDWATFLVNFVVEQTGYPPEIVELDADLEADLGIDSIKKAQMFGEIGEQFHIEADESLTLDDFPTLRDVIGYLETHVDGGVGGSEGGPSQPTSVQGNASAPAPNASPSSMAAAIADRSPKSAVQAVATETGRRSVTQPLIDSLERLGDRYVARCLLDPECDPFLVQHQLNQVPLLPAVAGLELFAQTFAAIASGSPIWQFRDVEITQALKFPGDRKREVRVIAERCPNGWEMKLVSDALHHSGTVMEQDRIHATGRVLEEPLPSEWADDRDEPRFPMHPMEYPDDAPLVHGPALRTLKKLLFQRDGGWGRLVAPSKAELAGSRSPTGWLVPAALLDGTLVACSIFSEYMCGPRPEIPAGFEHLELVRDPEEGEQCMLRLHFRRSDERHSWFDFVLCGADGTPVLRCRGMRNALLTQGSKR